MSPESTITFIRHAKKGSDGQLTQEGIDKAREFETSHGRKQDLIIYTSNIQRAIDTGSLIAEAVGARHPKPPTELLSESPYTDEKIDLLGLSKGKWLQLTDESAGLPPTKYMAGKIASFVLEMGDNPAKHILAVTHVPPIMCFLGYALAFHEGKNMIDDDIKEKTYALFGGKIPDPLHGFDISYLSNVSVAQYTLSIANQRISIPKTFLTETKKAFTSLI